MSAGSQTTARRPVFWVIFAAAMALPVLVWMWQPDHARRHGSSAGTLPDYGSLPDFSLVERSGREIGARDLAGAPWFADFIYTTCEGVCPKLSAEMAKLARRIGAPSRVKLVSFSVDPLKDTPEALREYATRFQASPDDWLFLTGEANTLRKLIRNGFHLAVVDPPADEPKLAGIITHSEKIVLVDAGGRIRRYYDGREDGWIDQALGDLSRLPASPAETRS